MMRALIRKILPAVIRRPLADIYYHVMWRCRDFLNRKSTEYYVLFSKEPVNGYFIQKVFYKFIQKILNNDQNPNYKKLFIKFEQLIHPLLIERQYNNEIIFMISSLGPGGAERQAVATLLGLHGRKIGPLSLAAFFLKSPEQSFYLPRLLENNIHTTELANEISEEIKQQVQQALKAVKVLPDSLRDVTNCVYTLAQRKPQIVHIWLDEPNIKAGLAAAALGIPKIILSTRSLPPTHFTFYQPYMREGYRWLVRQPGVILLNNSYAGAREYEKWLSLPKGVIQVVRNGFNSNDPKLQIYRQDRLHYRKKFNIPLDVPLIGTVMRICVEKRPLLWLEIASNLHKLIPQAHFIIVGDGPLRDKLEKKCVENKMEKLVHFVGYEREVYAAITSMNLFLLTSRVEGLPNVLIEAQALGVPVVTTNVGGAAETLEPGRSGWVLDNEDPEKIAQKMAELILNKKWMEEAKNYSEEYVRKTFSLERMLDETLEYYGTNIPSCCERYSETGNEVYI